MEVKINQGKEMIDATIEMVDGVMVVSPKEVQYEPKDGDVIVSGGDTRFVAIFNKMRFDYSFFYYALLVLDGDKRPQINNWASFLNVRPATEEEKKAAEDNLLIIKQFLINYGVGFIKLNTMISESVKNYKESQDEKQHIKEMADETKSIEIGNSKN